MNEKHHYLDFLKNTKYDGVKDVMEHIPIISSYFNKLNDFKMDIDDDFLTNTIM